MKADELVFEDHLHALLGQLSLEQKVRLVSGGDLWSIGPEPAIGMGRVVLSDGPAGVRGERFLDERAPSVCLPAPSAMAATWDETLITRLTGLLAAEARRAGVHVVLGPTINLHRSPFSGRHFECFSEDPVLTGRMAAAYVAGLQSFGVGACPKHFVCNDSETDRFTVDVQVDEQPLREVYLAPFERAVAAGAWLVMASYNAVNGHTMTENPLLVEPLKEEWGFDGVVVSDWTAVRSTEAAGAGGNDLAMPGPSTVWGERLVTAVREARVPEAALDDKVRRILRLAGRVGALESVAAPRAEIPEPVDTDSLLREAAAQSMVLLRNDGELLPLDDAHHIRRIAVLGPHATDPQIQGGGSATVQPPYLVSPLEGIRSALRDEDVVVRHHVGAEIPDEMRPAAIDLLINPHSGDPGVRVRLLDPNGDEVHAENRRTARLLWSWDELAGVATIEVVTRLRARRAGLHKLGVIGLGAVRLEAGSAVLVDEIIDHTDTGDSPTSLARIGEIKLTDDEEIDVVLTYAVPGPEHRSGLAAFVGTALTLVAHEPKMPDDEALAAAVAAAQQADVAVVVVGTAARQETEGRDRTTLKLPGRQDELVRRVAAANPQTVVVVNAGAPIEMPWHADVSAVLVSWFPGQQFGYALADVLFGIREPGGRLPTTWAMRQQDVPVLTTRPDHGRLHYTEGLHIGYRAWATNPTPPAYPFGHGLGYTIWDYRDLHAPEQCSASSPTTVHVHIANTGARSGREIVQIYLHRPDSTIDRPALWLAGFASVTADPGDEVDVAIELDARAFQHWSTTTGRWETEPGTFTVLAGRSATHLPLHAHLTVNTDNTDNTETASPEDQQDPPPQARDARA